MVEDRLTDPRRIAELLASELTGLNTGSLSEVSVIDADPEATPSADGTEAYGIEYRDRRVGTVSLYPGCVTVRLSADAATVPKDPPVSLEESGDRVVIRIEDGATVKRAVDMVRTSLGDGPP